MTVAKAPQFKSFEEYLVADHAALPEGRFEYWDGELVEVMMESLFNDGLAKYLMFMLMNIGIPLDLIFIHSCEIAVPGRPRTRFPDLVVLEEAHRTLLAKRSTITQKMPPPRLIVEVASPGDEDSDNYQRDYVQKPRQYAAIQVSEYWIIDPDRAVVKVSTLVDGTYQFRDFSRQALASGPIPLAIPPIASQNHRQIGRNPIKDQGHRRIEFHFCPGRNLSPLGRPELLRINN
jgi:Uma2 family endonuclease